MPSTRPARVPSSPFPLHFPLLSASICICESQTRALDSAAHTPRTLPYLQQCLLHFPLASVKLCSAFCILIALSLAFNEQSGLFLYWGPVGKVRVCAYERTRWNPRFLAWWAVGRCGIAIYLRENVHLTCGLNSKEMSSTRLSALWQLKRRLEGGLLENNWDHSHSRGN